MKTRLIVTAILCACGVSAQASMLTFIHEGNGSGMLDGNLFPPSDFVVTATVDTAARQSYAAGWFTDHLSASILIAGVGNFDFLTATRTFVNNDVQLVGFSRADIGGVDLFNGPTAVPFGAWDMLDPIGPIGGTGGLANWAIAGDVDTTGGVLAFDDGGSDAIFTAMPEPAAISMLGLGMLSLLRRRRM